MEYAQFIKMLEGENLGRKETVKQLKEITQQYPYFQTAQVLLAKALHEQNNIDFDTALKLAAVYAGDRAFLFDYITKESNSTATSNQEYAEEPIAEIKKEETSKKIFETKIPEPVIPTPAPSFIKEYPYTEYFSEDEISGIEEDEEKEEKVYDPHDLIRKRLSEILGAPSTPSKEEPNVPPKAQDEDVISEPIIPSSEIKIEEQKEVKPEPIQTKTEPESPKEEIISKEAERAKDDPLSRMEVEYAMEASILESLEKLPPLPQTPKEKSIPEIQPFSKIETTEATETASANSDNVSSPRSFTEWLRTISPKPFHNYIEVHSVPDVKHIKVDEPLVPEEEAIETSSTEDELIDKFIATEPKIVPSKTEFYSPISQAKKSLIEHDDVVSETLAKIYRDQGNLARARWCYERLMLLHPEKSSFFAALLKEIDEINKEDL
jgi:hypothetical protein